MEFESKEKNWCYKGLFFITLFSEWLVVKVLIHSGRKEVCASHLSVSLILHSSFDQDPTPVTHLHDLHPKVSSHMFLGCNNMGVLDTVHPWLRQCKRLTVWFLKFLGILQHKVVEHFSQNRDYYMVWNKSLPFLDRKTIREELGALLMMAGFGGF